MRDPASIGRVAGVREPVKAVSIMLLHGTGFGHRIAPSHGTGAPVTGLAGAGGRVADLEPFPITALLLSGCEGHEGVSFVQSAWSRRPCRCFRRPAALLPQQDVGQHDERAHHGDDRHLVGLAGGLEALEHACEIPIEA